jgi:hypothetical protein
VPFDPIRVLLDRQLAAWKGDPEVAAGHLYLISRTHSLDVEVSKVGDSPGLSEEQLKTLLRRAAGDERAGFEMSVGHLRGYVYPLKQDAMLQGAWLLFPAGQATDWAGWKRDAQRFSEELFTLRQASLGNPPTFRQLVESFPAYEEAVEEPAAPSLHWERSQSRVVMTVEDELSDGLMVDHLPIF